MSDTMAETHPTQIIETEQGNIVMSMPDTARATAFSNSVFTYLFTDEELLEYRELEDEAQKKKYMDIRTMKRNATAMQLTFLSCIQSAPFHLNDYSVEPILDLKSFLEFVNPDIMGKMANAVKDLGLVNPLSK